MKIQKIDTPAAGSWPRDCELICLIDYKGFKIIYRREDDDTHWSLDCKRIVAYKVLSEEFSRTGYLMGLPIEGAFFEIQDSPWISEFVQYNDIIINKCKHYVLRFYDETIEIIAQDYIFTKLNKVPEISYK
jgi:hypothetical protein